MGTGGLPGITPTHSSVSCLCPNYSPCALSAGLGVQEVVGKTQPHLSVGWDEVMGAQLTSQPLGTHPSAFTSLCTQGHCYTGRGTEQARKRCKDTHPPPPQAGREAGSSPTRAHRVASAPTFHIYLSSSSKTRKRHSSVLPPAARGPSLRVGFQQH